MLNINEMVRAHGDQMWGEFPYAEHLRSVALMGEQLNAMLDNKFDRMVARRACFAHDLLEDTKVRAEDLEPEIRVAVVQVSRNLSQDEDMSYQDYIEHLVHSGSDLAIFVKLADAIANYRLSRKSQNHRIVRYKKSVPVLWNAVFDSKVDWSKVKAMDFAIEEH